MVARIYKPAKSPMQSGLAKTHEWVLEHEPNAGRRIEPLMGWTSAPETATQVRLTFASKEDAIAYASKNGIAYTLAEPKPRKQIRKSYADNFRYGRLSTWTH